MYASDLNDREWEQLQHYFEHPNGYGKRAKYSRRTLVNGILYVMKTGCQWRMLPNDYPTWKTVYSYFRCLSRKGVWKKVVQQLGTTRRLSFGRNDLPSFDGTHAKRLERGECARSSGGHLRKRKKSSVKPGAAAVAA